MSEEGLGEVGMSEEGLGEVGIGKEGMCEAGMDKQLSVLEKTGRIFRKTTKKETKLWETK